MELKMEIKWANWELIKQLVFPSDSKPYTGGKRVEIAMIGKAIPAGESVWLVDKEDGRPLQIGFTAPVPLEEGDICAISTLTGAVLWAAREQKLIYVLSPDQLDELDKSHESEHIWHIRLHPS